MTSRIFLAYSVVVCVASAFAAEPKIVEEKLKDGSVALVAENYMLCPITLSLHVKGSNVHSVPSAPMTLVVPADKHERLTVVGPAKTSQAWRYTWTWHWEEGSMKAKHDESVEYALPYPSGTAWKVGQGFHGKFSHHGEEEYAIDWPMPVGSPVCAARAGRVVRMAMDSNVGGADLTKFGDKANYIHILHADGSIGTYLHFRQHGAVVKLGDTVKAAVDRPLGEHRLLQRAAPALPRHDSGRRTQVPHRAHQVPHESARLRGAAGRQKLHRAVSVSRFARRRSRAKAHA